MANSAPPGRAWLAFQASGWISPATVTLARIGAPVSAMRSGLSDVTRRVADISSIAAQPALWRNSAAPSAMATGSAAPPRDRPWASQPGRPAS